ncbi:MAG TPA: cytochrome C [Thermoanaerobaculia bacterium]
MKTFFKVVGIIVLVVVALAAIGVGYLSFKKPAQRPASTEKIDVTPERLARGKYLVHHVSLCLDCHSERTSAYALPMKPGGEGVRGFVWDKSAHFPGVVAASNLTPDKETGLGQWTDGEIVRAMREGVDRNGAPLFPIMPYTHFRHMSDEDAQSIVAYLRTVKAQRYVKPAKSLDVPLNFVEKFVPQPLTAAVPAPNPNDHIAYGKYLTTIAVCGECHTPKDDKGKPIAGMEFAGGYEMTSPFFHVRTANITPHPSTYIGRSTREEFVARFKAFATMNASNAPNAEPGKNTVMPWLSYAGMSDADLGAIYDYLKTLPAVENQVDTFPDAK